MKGRDILIVEDENIVALDMRMRLEAMDYNVVDVVDTGSLALERAVALEPDLVLMDIKLKGDQDGIEAASRLRERSEAPVIFVTAFTDERTLDRAKLVSPYGYIVKPFHERELRIGIELALYKHQYELSIRRARDIAEEANRVKGEFLANMSHELKTPLNSVIGFTELAMATSREPEQREQLALALSSAKSLLTLIESILDFARMEAGKLNSISMPFSLDEVLDDCADSLAISAFPKGLEVSLSRDPEIPDALVGDSSLLKHILLNLADNAVKFTERGRVSLRASLHDQPACPGGRPTIEFEVTDTGIGMPKDKIEFAFTRFTQLDPSRTRKAGGTGLGLAIVAKSVELMGGVIAVDSEERRGTRFTLRIPFEPASIEAQGPSSKASVLSLEGAAALGVEASTRKGVAVAGFDDEGAPDATLALARLGLAARRVASLNEAAAAGKGLVLADERIAVTADRKTIDALRARLVVATRFGGNARALLGREPGIAFVPLPLRARSLRDAILSLSARGAVEDAPAVPAMGEIPDAKPPESLVARGKGLSAQLAVSLETAAAAGRFSEAEREAKDAQVAMADAGDKLGSRLAFAALLAARKCDVEGLMDAASRIRATADERAAERG